MITGQIPFSNPAGNNQMSPTPKGVASPIAVGNIPGSPSQTQNPYTIAPPARPESSSSTLNSLQASPQDSASQGFITNASSYSSGENNLQKQLIDIYGKGVGGSLFALLNSMSGTNSTILQEYIQSLQPQMAQAQANTNAALGAGGVSANSSVAGIADAALQSQEFAAISSESAKLTQAQEGLTAQILAGMEGPAAKEVASSGWSVFADVMNNITGDIGNIVSGGSFKTPGNTASYGDQGGGFDTTIPSSDVGTPDSMD